MIGIVASLTSCERFLDLKPNKALAVPNKLQDLQALLDDNSVINSSGVSAGEVSSDDYYLTESTWAGITQEVDRRMYIWEKDYVFLASANDWFRSYQIIYSANIVLDNLAEIEATSSNQQAWNNIKGQALFIRAKQFFQNVLVWSKIYDSSTAKEDLGIPLRVSQDFNVPSVRPSVDATYRQVIKDLRDAMGLLPDKPLAKTRASLPAAYGLLGRVYLAMGEYDSCFHFTDLALKMENKLLDYNTEIDPDTAQPFQQFNDEVIVEGYMRRPTALYPNNAKVDSVLYGMYKPGDVRTLAFFRDNQDGTYGFKGNYSVGLFDGIAVDELYLMRAECNARLGEVRAALDDLNTLLRHRFEYESFTPVDVSDSNDLLQLILDERRKELLFRGIRWMDIKRYNRDGAGIELVRNIGDIQYKLPAKSNRFALPIPELVIERSGMQQNRY